MSGLEPEEWERMSQEQRELYLRYMTEPPSIYPRGMRQEMYRGRHVRLGDFFGGGYRRWIPVDPNEAQQVWEWLASTKQDTSGMISGTTTGLPYVRDDVWQDFLAASILAP